MRVKVKLVGVSDKFVEYKADRIECHIIRTDTYTDTEMVLKYADFPDIKLSTSLYEIIVEE